MLFSKDEVIAIISALESFPYDDPPYFFPIKPERSTELARSCTEKLNNLTGITFFTKQEFTLMAAAINVVIEAFISSGEEVPAEHDMLFDKLCTLSDPGKK